MLITQARSAIVIADGDERRLMPKKFSNEGGESCLLEYVLDSVWTVADEIYVVFQNEPDLGLVESIAPFGVKILIQKKGLLTARLEAGFKATRSEHCLVVQDNHPFVKPNVIFALFEAARGHDAAIPRWSDGRVEPLLAVYRRQTFLRINAQIKDSDDPGRIVDLLYAVRFVEIEEELSPLDPGLNTFFAVNNEQDLQQAKLLATVGRGP